MRIIVSILLLSTSFLVNSGTPSTNRFCLSPGVQIPDDDPTGITSTLSGINFSGGTVTDVDLQVEIQHEFVSDLVISLKHENLATSTIIYDNFDCTGSDLDIVFDDSATNPSNTCNPGSPAASGAMLPIIPLSKFDGLAGASSWSLRVTDYINIFTGTLDRWCLFLNIDYNDVGLDAPGFFDAELRPADIPSSVGQRRIAGDIGMGDYDDYIIHNLRAGEQLNGIFLANYQGQDSNSHSGLVLQRGAYPSEAKILDSGMLFGALDINNYISVEGLPVYGPESILISIVDVSPEPNGEYYEFNLETGPASTTQTMWQESMDGELPNMAEGAPMVRAVPRGTGQIIANNGGSGDVSDSFSVKLRKGQVLNSISLESYGSNSAASYYLYPGDAGQGQGVPYFGYSNWNSSNIGEDLLDNIGLETIRGPALFTLEIIPFSPGELTTYTLLFEEDSIFVEDFDARVIDIRPPALNELIVDLPGSDAGNELVEILGDPGFSYPGYYFVSMEGDAGSGASGIADRVISLANTPFGKNGLMVIHGSATPFSIDQETAQIPVSGFSLENGTNSFLIVYAPDGLTQGVDYDTNDDGVLEFPVGSWIADAVSLTDGGASDIQYGGAALFDAGFRPGAMTRFPQNRNRHDVTEWYFGTLTGTVPNLDYSGNVSDNFPGNGDVTPGSPNVE